MMRRLALVLLLLPAACGGGNNAPDPEPAANQQPVDNSAANLREALKLRDRAKLYIEKGDYSGAADLAEQAVKLAPDEPTVHDQLGYAYEGLRRFDDALAAFTRALELFEGKHTSYTPRHASYCAFRLALAAFDRRDYDAAVPLIARAIELKSGDPELHMLQGRILYQRKEFLAAAEAFGIAADFAVGDKVYEALRQKGESQFHAGEYRPAIETFSRIINDGVEGLEAYGWRAYCWVQVGKKPEAESDFNQAALRTTSAEKRAEYEAALKALAEVK
jgi:Flp pilus assembly protein TadD